MKRPCVSAIIVAGGNGARMGSKIPKQFLKINGRDVIMYTIDSFVASGCITDYVVVCHGDYADYCKNLMSEEYPDLNIRVVEGGESRRESVYKGLKSAENSDYVLIHDAVRCCVPASDINKVCEAVIKEGSCALGVKVKDTIKIADEKGFVKSTPAREFLWQIQTPQAFKYDLIMRAHENPETVNISVTDDCALAEMSGEKVKIIEGSYENIKLTTPSDMMIARMYLERERIS